MLQRIASNMTDILLKKGIFKDEDRDIYVYGFEALFSTLLNIIILLFIGTFLGLFTETIIYLTAFGLLRVYCGGYHAKTHLGCILLFLLIYCLVMAMITFLPSILSSNTGIASVSVSSMSFLVILKFAPLEHKNRSFTGNEYKNFRVLSITIAILELTTVCVILLLVRESKTALIISMAMLSVAFILALAKIIERKR